MQYLCLRYPAILQTVRIFQIYHCERENIDANLLKLATFPFVLRAVSDFSSFFVILQDVRRYTHRIVTPIHLDKQSRKIHLQMRG